MQKKRTIKAWAIVTDRGKLIGSNIELPPGGGMGGITKYPAIYLLKVFAQRRLSWFADNKGTKIVPCTITYSH